MTSHEENLVQACCLTGTGRSAVAVIGVRGDIPLHVLGKCFQPSRKAPLLPRQIRYGQWQRTGKTTSPDAPAESIVITLLATDHYEIHCHGGSAAIERILSDLKECNVRVVPPQQWDSLSKTLLSMEAETVLRNCITQRTAGIVLAQIQGGLIDWVERTLEFCQQGILNQSLGERTPKSNQLSSNSDKTLPHQAGNLSETIRQEAKQIELFSEWTTRLAIPFRVVLAGSPNVGKSSLMNAILGYDRSITFDQAGTTRDVLYAETVLDGIPVQVADTAGLHEIPLAQSRPQQEEAELSDLRRQHQQVEQLGIARARKELAAADLIVHVTAADQPDHSNSGIEMGDCMIRVVNKADLANQSLSQGLQPNGSVATIATSGAGIAALNRAIIAKLVPQIPDSGQPVVLNKRQAKLISSMTRSSTLAEIIHLLDQLRGG